ncbi:MAG: divalent-cation tolerance protein CutA [Acidobacteriota bacterium]|jgi:periplasmic divalent cation tolerance protein
MGATVVVTTVGTEDQANLIARELVARREAACVNIIKGVRSVYRWQGQICNDGEFLLIAKTMETEFDAISETIRELHSYDVPEILTFDVGQGEREFLDWIAACVDKDAPFPDDDVDERDLPALD